MILILSGYAAFSYNTHNRIDFSQLISPYVARVVRFRTSFAARLFSHYGLLADIEGEKNQQRNE